MRVKRAMLSILLALAMLALAGCRYAAVESGETVIIEPAATEAPAE